MLHRIREAWSKSGVWDIAGMDKFLGPVEVDETYVGGKIKNMSNSRRAAHYEAGSPDNKMTVVGVKDRNTNRVQAKVVERVDSQTMDALLQEFAHPDAEVYSDGALVYKGIPFEHSWVNHSIKQYVDGKVHTNGIESLWATLKRAYVGTFHHMSIQHLQRYVTEFQGRHNIRDLTILAGMTSVVIGMIGKRLMYRELTNNPASSKQAKAEAIKLEAKKPPARNVMRTTPTPKPKRRLKRPVSDPWAESSKRRNAGPTTIVVDPGKPKRKVRAKGGNATGKW